VAKLKVVLPILSPSRWTRCTSDTPRLFPTCFDCGERFALAEMWGGEESGRFILICETCRERRDEAKERRD
jgi:hypothetical protein